jgi:hypothetical protein
MKTITEMSLIIRIIRALFLVKEIISKEGKVHFRRYRLLATPWFNIYIHQILKSDEDAHFHDHPWNFLSYILKGSYHERWTSYPDHKWEYDTVWSSLPPQNLFKMKPRRVIRHHAQDAHSITILTPEVWTLVFTSGRARVWGYQTPQGWIDFKTYRQLKNEGKLR